MLFKGVFSARIVSFNIAPLFHPSIILGLSGSGHRGSGRAAGRPSALDCSSGGQRTSVTHTRNLLWCLQAPSYHFASSLQGWTSSRADSQHSGSVIQPRKHGTCTFNCNWTELRAWSLRQDGEKERSHDFNLSSVLTLLTLTNCFLKLRED